MHGWKEGQQMWVEEQEQLCLTLTIQRVKLFLQVVLAVDYGKILLFQIQDLHGQESIFLIT
jgi:hypothetical protein